MAMLELFNTRRAGRSRSSSILLKGRAQPQHAQRSRTMGTDHWALLIATLNGVELPGLMLFW